MKTIVWVFLLGTGIAMAASSEDFYEARLHAGEAELRAGQPLQAITELRIAAFGFLDRPPLLCRALAALAVAQERAGRHDEQQATLSRFVEVERRFSVYQKAEIPPDVRSEFAATLRKRLPASTVNSLTEVAAAPLTRAPEKATAKGSSPHSAEPEHRASLTPPAPPAPSGADRTERAVQGVDQPPRVRSTVRPVYPPDALKAGIGGTVLLRVLVSDTGVPLQVEVVRGIRADLAEAAIAAVRQWRFEPARRGDRNVAAWTSASVPFQR